MSIGEYFKSYFYLLDSPLRYFKAYKNFFTVMRNLLKKKFPFEGKLRNGKNILITNYYEAYLASFGILDGYSIKGNSAIINIDNFPEITLSLGNDNGDIHGVFFKKVYSFLPVKNRFVIDIGANIGDSSIYFALCGAKKVIALEPFPKNNQTAQKNIEANHLLNKIILILAGCSKEKSEIIINSEQEGAGSATDETNSGIKVPFITLENLVNQYDIPNDSVMKIDCEGCEYDVIMSSSKSLLRKFTHIEVEYHYGYRNLEKKLEECGFKIKHSSPMFISNKQSNTSMYFGYLYATRI